MFPNKNSNYKHHFRVSTYNPFALVRHARRIIGVETRGISVTKMKYMYKLN